MRQRPVNRNGFTPIEGLVILLLVAVIAFGGWFVGHRDHKTKSVSSTSHSSSSASVTNSFAACEAAIGSITQRTSPEKCVTKDGESFTDTPTSPQANTHPTKIAEYTAGSIYSLGGLAGSDNDRQLQVGAVDRYCTSYTAPKLKDGSIVVTTDATFFSDTSGNYSYDAKTQSVTIVASCYNLANPQELPAAKKFELKYQDNEWVTTNYTPATSDIREP